jgi:hypothetical protein
MNQACGQERYIQSFGVETRGKEHYLEDLGVDQIIMLRWIFTKLDGGIDWIGLAQNRDR